LIANEEGKAVNQERTGREKEEAQREAGSKESLRRKRLRTKAYTVSYHFLFLCCFSVVLGTGDPQENMRTDVL